MKNHLFILIGLIGMLITSCSKEKKANTTILSESNKNAIEQDLNSTADKSGVVFKDDKINSLYAHYLEVKKHLVNSDTKKVKKTAKKLEKFLAQHNFDKSFEATANLIALTKDLQKQRDFFKTLSEETQKVIMNSTIVSGELYTQFCPMAFDGNGGFWLSDSKEIRNPYYGSKMLKCGTVENIIK